MGGVSLQAFGVSVGINGAICITVFAVFSMLRTLQYTRKYFCPKRFENEQVIKPAKLPNSLMGWVMPVFTYPEEEVIAVAGTDAAVYLRIMKFGVDLFTRISLFSLAFVLPVNLVAAHRRKAAQDLDSTYMSNIPANSSLLWVHLVASYVVVYIVLKLVERYNRDITRIRVQYLATNPRGGPSHTALITDIPGVKCGTVLDAVSHLMNDSILRFAPHSVKMKVADLMDTTFNTAKGGIFTVADIAVRAVKRISNEDENDGRDKTKEELLFDEAMADPWDSALKCLQSGMDFKGLVTHQMEMVFGRNTVVAVNPVYNQEVLEPLLATYDATKRNLEDLVDHYMSELHKLRHDHAKPQRKQVQVVGPLLGAWGIERYGAKPSKADQLNHLMAYLDECRRLIRETEPLALQDPTCSSFVTLRDRYTQTVAATSLICQEETSWRGQDAPGADEVVWKNLRMRSWERALWSLAMWALFVTILLTYIPVCAAIQALIQVDKVANNPVLKPLLSHGAIKGIVSGILPTLVLKIFLAILPTILSVMESKAGAVSRSQIDFGVMSKYYWFQFFTVFVAQIVANSLLSEAKNILDNPGEIMGLIRKVSNGIPDTAGFFINFILLNALSARPINLLRVVGLVLFWLFSKLAATERARKRLWAKQETLLGPAVADHMITLLLGIVFSVMSPLLTVICLIYFLVASITERYQMVYVYRLPYESGGKLWMTVFNQIMVGLYVFLFALTYMMLAKGFPFVPLMLPLFFIVFIFHMTTQKLFSRPWTVMSLRTAALIDGLEKQMGMHELDEAELESIKKTYLSPCFKVSDEEHARLLLEASNVNRCLNDELPYEQIMHPEEEAAPETPPPPPLVNTV